MNIAYQVVDGDGPDLVYVSGWVSHLDMMWQDRRQRAFLERLATMGRLILFDKRGAPSMRAWTRLRREQHEHRPRGIRNRNTVRATA